MRKVLAVAGLALLVSAFAQPASAGLITFTGIGGASATFQDSGTTLTVTFTNGSTGDVLDPSQVLTAVFFQSTIQQLTRTSAVLNAGSTVIYDNDGQPAGGVVGGEWAYLSQFSTYGANSGISSSGLTIFGPGNLFPGADLEPPDSPDGVQYGLVGAGDNAATGNTGITGSGGLIRNSVVFTLGGWTSGVSAATAISRVTFQYGTSLDEPHTGGVCTSCVITGNSAGDTVPEPASLALFGLAALGAATRFRRSR